MYMPNELPLVTLYFWQHMLTKLLHG